MSKSSAVRQIWKESSLFFTTAIGFLFVRTTGTIKMPKSSAQNWDTAGKSLAQQTGINTVGYRVAGRVIGWIMSNARDTRLGSSIAHSTDGACILAARHVAAAKKLASRVNSIEQMATDFLSAL